MNFYLVSKQNNQENILWNQISQQLKKDDTFTLFLKVKIYNY